MKTPDINGKTPEEIKKGLECGFCHECPYDDDEQETVEECARQVHKDALAYIQHLESRLAQAERERDAAVRDLDNALALDEVDDCHFCKHIKKPTCHECKWEWRGVCAENTKEES